MCFSVGRIHWDVQFYRSVHDWELESLALFMDIVYSSSAGGIGLAKSVGSQQRVEVLRYKDIIILYPSFGHIFSKENGEAIEGSSKVAYSSRSVFLRKILTTDNLQKMCIIFLYWCYMCKRCGESVDHLLLHCPIAYELWSSLFFLFGIHWVMPHRVIDCLSLGRVSSVKIAI